MTNQNGTEKLYNVIAYHNGRRFCVAEEGLTLEQALAYIDKNNGVNGWTYFTEEVK